MRDYRRIEAFHLLDQIAAEVYATVHLLDPDDRAIIGLQMQHAVGRALSALIQGCSSRNTATFIPFVEVAHGSTEELGYQLRHCRRLRIVSEAHSDLLLQRQQHASRQLLQLLQRLMLREMGQTDEFEWDDTVDGIKSPGEVLSEPPKPKRPRGRPPKTGNGLAAQTTKARSDA